MKDFDMRTARKPIPERSCREAKSEEGRSKYAERYDLERTQGNRCI